MNSLPYLYAAYAATWIIHLTYLGTIVRRYLRARGRMEEFTKSSGR